MQQKELAILLDISPAMVSRLAKKGMPTDDLERAQRWRKRHLEPGRVKGMRAGTVKPQPPAPPKPANPPPPPPVLGATVADMEAVGDLIDGALNRGNQDAAAFRIMQLRTMFRQSTDAIQEEGTHLTVRVWVALLDYTLHQAAAIRHAPDMAAYLTAGECGERIPPEGGAWAAHTVIWECCDLDDNAINGWPDGEGDSDA
jgi:hypothetical protein